MKTITFYSYKGGVGRSLALVNIATRLIEFGKKVCVIDFDLEAPGLHYKFPLVKQSNIKRGIVDFVYEFANKGIIDENIKQYSIDIQVSSNSKALTLIPAGNTESDDYWKKLSAINWYDLMYENPNGLAFFLKLKEYIKKEINPDFLLIDSRTGISETSGITLSLLAEEVVVVAANNKENLNGAKKIIKSLNNPDNNIIGIEPKITFVLSRIPFTDKPEDRNREQLLINKIKRNFLNPYINEINVIHSDRELEVEERVKIAHEKEESAAQISLDYLKLFEKLTKNDLTQLEIERFNNVKDSERIFNKAVVTENQTDKLNLINEAINLNDSNLEFYLYRSNLYFNMKKHDESISDANFILTKNSKNINASILLIDNYVQQKDFVSAEKLTDKLLHDHPNNIDALIKKILILIRTNEIEKAEKFSTKIINIDPELSLGYSCRGDIRRRLKKFTEAYDDTYKALELNSENNQALATLAEIHAEQGNINEFYIFLENALKNDRAYIQECIVDEDIYQKFINDERFINLLNKYGVIY